MVMTRRYVRCFVPPVLEQLSVCGGIWNQRARMFPEARKQRQLLATNEHVDRVDLDEADSVENATKVLARNFSPRTRSGKTLCCERDASRSGNVEVSRQR